MPRLRSLRKALEGVRAPKPFYPKTASSVGPEKPASSVESEKPAPTTSSRYPDPEKYSSHSRKIYADFVRNVEENKPHFPIGGKEVYFPWAPITLMPPSAKMTPFQAQFMVPRTFNKLDLRDYLWHLYGLRALNITTQLKWSQWHRERMSRYRTPQVKKMIIEMEQPFIWPRSTKELEEHHQKTMNLAFTEFEEEVAERKGSDKNKPSKAFNGILGPYPKAPEPWVPKTVRAQLANTKAREARASKRKANEAMIGRFLKL